LSKRHLATLYGVLVAVLWGFSFLSIKVAVAVIPPMTLAAARFILACVVLAGVAVAGRQSLRLARRDVLPLVLGGLFGVTAYFYCENNGILRLSASESSILIGTIPVFSVIAERLFLGTRLPGRVYLGSLLSLGGIVLIVARQLGTPSSLVGYVYMMGAVVAWVAYTFATRGVSTRCGRLCIAFWQSLFGLAGCVPFALAEAPAWQMPSVPVIGHVVYLGILCSAAGYWLYVASVEGIGVARASIFINLIPVVAVVAAFFVLGDRLGLLQLGGGGLVLMGVFLATA
jgi:drug/metabolite transporter (DMT)-like permease